MTTAHMAKESFVVLGNLKTLFWPYYFHQSTSPSLGLDSGRILTTCSLRKKEKKIQAELAFTSLRIF